MIFHKRLTGYFVLLMAFLCLFLVSTADATNWSIQNNSSSIVIVKAECNGQTKEVEVGIGGSKSGLDTSCEWGSFRWQTKTYMSGSRFGLGELLSCKYNCCSTGIADKAAVTLQEATPSATLYGPNSGLTEVRNLSAFAIEAPYRVG